MLYGVKHGRKSRVSGATIDIDYAATKKFFDVRINKTYASALSTTMYQDNIESNTSEPNIEHLFNGRLQQRCSSLYKLASQIFDNLSLNNKNTNFVYGAHPWCE